MTKFVFRHLFMLITIVGGSLQAKGKEPHHKGTLSSINLGFRYSSVFQNREVIFYCDFQIDPVVAVFLFDDRLEFLGDSVGFRDFVFEDRVRLRTRIISVTDKPIPVPTSLKK